jgi:hypothetical protein
MRQGNWTLELQALSGRSRARWCSATCSCTGSNPSRCCSRSLQRGFRKNEKLVLGAANGKGYVRYDGQQREFAGADAAARAFLQDSFIGLVLGWQQQQPAKAKPMAAEPVDNIGGVDRPDRSGGRLRLPLRRQHCAAGPRCRRASCTT